MAAGDSEVRPETFALDTLIRETLSRTLRDRNASAGGALLFSGNRYHDFPGVVVQDPVLEPVDKLVWMVIYQRARAPGAKAVFPSYADIARLTNVSSTSTVSRAIAILRATRWLSLYARSRDAGGRLGGNVYALHDEPLPLIDALHLDPDYMAFLQAAGNHHHARVRRVVAAVSASLDEDITAATDVLAPINRIEHCLEVVRAIEEGGGRQYFRFSATVLSTLSNAGAVHPPPGQRQNSKVAGAIPDPQNSKAVTGSSNNYINTTTTTLISKENAECEAASFDALIFPARLDENHRELAVKYLKKVPLEDRQAVLDELAGRILAERRGATPLYDEVRYLHRLCVAAGCGRFNPNLGIKVRGERDRRRREAERSREEAATREAERRERGSRPRGESPLAEIRKQLKIPRPPKSKSR